MTEEINFDSGEIRGRPPKKTGEYSVFTKYAIQCNQLRSIVVDKKQEMGISGYCNTGSADMNVTIGQPNFGRFMGDVTNFAGGIADAIGPAHPLFLSNMKKDDEKKYDPKIHPKIPILLLDDAMISVLHVERVTSEYEWYRLQVSGNYDENSQTIPFFDSIGYNDSL